MTQFISIHGEDGGRLIDGGRIWGVDIGMAIGEEGGDPCSLTCTV